MKQLLIFDRRLPNDHLFYVEMFVSKQYQKWSKEVKIVIQLAEKKITTVGLD